MVLWCNRSEADRESGVAVFGCVLVAQVTAGVLCCAVPDDAIHVWVLYQNACPSSLTSLFPFSPDQEFDATREGEISIINRLAAERQDNVMWREFRTRLLRNMGLVSRQNAGARVMQHSATHHISFRAAVARVG